MNKKSGRPEELVSCADCGRSGECGPFLHLCPQTSSCPPARLCHLPWGGGRGGGKLVVVMISSAEESSGHWIFFFRWISRSHALGAREREGKNSGLVFGLFTKRIFLCVCCCEIVWEHLDTQATLSCIGCRTRNTKLRLFCGSAWAPWEVWKHDCRGSSYVLRCGSQRLLRCSATA